MKNLKIAIIDDSFVDRRIIKSLIGLVSPHIHILEFSGAVEALEYFGKHFAHEEKLPDIVFLDIYMPLMSGWEYLKHYDKMKCDLQKQSRHYIYTASIDPEDLNYRHANVYGTYIKPFNKESILEITEANVR